MGQERRTKRRRRRRKARICVACKETVSFCWHCPCGFTMCSACMQENLWGMTCNNITWTCPDCGAIRSFGNQ
jgi:hypothetical protein